jgi:RND family efflux transporter MFP subunit
MSHYIRVALIAAVAIGLGVGGFTLFPLLKKNPVEAEPEQQALTVEAVRVEPHDERVVISGFGTVHPVNEVRITPEVAGKVVEVHPRMDQGEIIPEGETLFVVDARTYQSQVDDAQATLNQLRAQLERLAIEYKRDQQRVKTLQRNAELAQAEFDRLHKLYHEEEVGTQSAVEQAERAFRTAEDQVDIMRKGLESFPAQMQEAESALRAAEARLEQAEVNLERTEVQAPFDARIKELSLEVGQYVAPGNSVLTLSDDSVLEIPLPLNSQEARQWLRFQEEGPPAGKAWFASLQPVEAVIQWTEDPKHHWVGTLDRVLEFDYETRTLTVAVRVTGEQARSVEDASMPLVAGMFCQVDIPGKVMENVYELPRSAVTFENTVYVADDQRLKTVPVEVVHEQAGYAYVAEGLDPGDQVIVTRLVNPLENTLLDVQHASLNEDEPGQAMASGPEIEDNAP